MRFIAYKASLRISGEYWREVKGKDSCLAQEQNKEVMTLSDKLHPEGVRTKEPKDRKEWIEKIPDIVFGPELDSVLQSWEEEIEDCGCLRINAS